MISVTNTLSVCSGNSPNFLKYLRSTSTVTFARILIVSVFIRPPAVSSGKDKTFASRSWFCLSKLLTAFLIRFDGSDFMMSARSSVSRFSAILANPSVPPSSISSSNKLPRISSLNSARVSPLF